GVRFRGVFTSDPVDHRPSGRVKGRAAAALAARPASRLLFEKDMNDGARPARNRLRVLLVEDAHDIREVFTLLLRAEGVDVVAAGSGREAMDWAARRDFDVVLTDLGLPD